MTDEFIPYYYITAWGGDDYYIWAGTGFELTDHVQVWPAWLDEYRAKKAFREAVEAAEELGFDSVHLDYMDEAGDRGVDEWEREDA